MFRPPRTIGDVKPRVRRAMLGQTTFWLEGIDAHIDAGEVPICYAAYEPIGAGFGGPAAVHVVFLTDRFLYWRPMDNAGRFFGDAYRIPHSQIEGVGPVKNRPRELALVIRPDPGSREQQTAIEKPAPQAALASVWRCRPARTAFAVHRMMLQALDLTVGREADVEHVNGDTYLVGHRYR